MSCILFLENSWTLEADTTVFSSSHLTPFWCFLCFLTTLLFHSSQKTKKKESFDEKKSYWRLRGSQLCSTNTGRIPLGTTKTTTLDEVQCILVKGTHNLGQRKNLLKVQCQFRFAKKKFFNLRINCQIPFFKKLCFKGC